MVFVKCSFERSQQNLLGGIGVGASVAAVLGAIAGAFLPSLSAIEGVVLGCLLGAGIGVGLGKSARDRVVTRVSEPLVTERSYVGAHAPDDVGEVGKRRRI